MKKNFTLKKGLFILFSFFLLVNAQNFSEQMQLNYEVASFSKHKEEMHHFVNVEKNNESVLDICETPAPVVSGADCIINDSFVFAEGYEALGGDGKDIAVDSEGNVYVIGNFAGTATFGNVELNSAGSWDIYLTKTDRLGNVLWAKSFGSTESDDGWAVTTDEAGNVYFTGYYTGTVAFGNYTLTASGGHDIFLVKMSFSGNILWAESYGGSQYDTVRKLEIDAAGNIFLVGNYTGTADIGGFTLNSSGQYDGFLVKTDNQGNVLFAKSYGGPQDDYINSIAIDSAGNVYFIGSFRGTASFGATNLTATGQEDGFLAKIDNSGNLLSVQKFGGSTWADFPVDITLDSNDNIYITGGFIGSLTLGSINLSSAGWQDLYVAKLNNVNNSVVWAKRFGGVEGDDGRGIAVDNAGNIYVTGVYRGGTITLGNIVLTAQGNPLFNEGFIMKTDNMGNVLSAKSFGGTGHDGGEKVVLDNMGNAFITGRQEAGIFGDFTLSEMGGFIAKYSGEKQCSFNFCEGAVLADIQVEGENLKWYSSPSSFDILEPNTILYNEGIYYVSQTLNGCESPRTKVIAIQKENSPAPSALPQVFCGLVTVADLVAEGENIQWYATADAAEPLSVETPLQTGTYHASQTSADGCEGGRTAVEVTVNNSEAPLAEDQLFCETATVADLNAEGENLQWYDSEDSTDPLAGDISLESGTYYVSQTIDFTQGDVFEGILSAYDFIGTSTELSGIIEPSIYNENLINETGDFTKSPNATSTSTTNTYTIQINNEEISTESENYLTFSIASEFGYSLSLEKVDIQTPSYVAGYMGQGIAQQFAYSFDGINFTLINEPVITVKTTAGSISVNFDFSNVAALQNIPAFTVVTLRYYASIQPGTATTGNWGFHGENGLKVTGKLNPVLALCESPRTAVEVTINEIPAPPVVVNPLQYHEGDTLADLEVEGENLTWYDADGNILDPFTTLIVEGEVYFVSQTINGCESEKTEIETEFLGVQSSDFAEFTYYPNPVKSVLHLSNDTKIRQVLIYTLAGELVMSKEVNSKKAELNIAHLPAATFVAKVLTDKEVKTVKVIKR